MKPMLVLAMNGNYIACAGCSCYYSYLLLFKCSCIVILAVIIYVAFIMLSRYNNDYHLHYKYYDYYYLNFSRLVTQLVCSDASQLIQFITIERIGYKKASRQK